MSVNSVSTGKSMSAQAQLVAYQIGSPPSANPPSSVHSAPAQPASPSNAKPAPPAIPAPPKSPPWQPPPTPALLPAAADFQSWSTDFSQVRDPLKLLARAMVAMSNAQAGLLRSQTAAIALLTERMSDSNGLLKALNTGLAALKAKGDEETSALFSGSQDEANGFKARLVAAGVDGANVSVSSASGKWKVVMSKKNMTAAASNVQLTVDGLGSSAQQAQLQLQTLVGRYNSTFELVTSAIRKSESQAGEVTSNIRR